jgi:glycosyltransferase involved in cell wall biosynthesis
MLRDVKGRVRFDVFGPLEDRGYWRECEDLIAALPPQIEVRYCGPIAHHEVARTLAQYDLFFFPTHGENYGHVIVEALRSGCPVLLSDKTPWRDLAGEGAGWDLPLDQPALFREALQQAVDMGPGEHRTMSESARAFGQRRSDDPEVVAQNRKLFQRALLRGARLAAHGSPEPCPG